MFRGGEIYDHLTRSAQPKEALKTLDDAELQRLLEEVERLPMEGGVPVLIGALVDEEIKERWNQAVKRAETEKKNIF